jgi:methyl-accepting chemotaxis protein
MVEEATAASHSLSGEASELAKLVAQFQTGAPARQNAQKALPKPTARPALANPRTAPIGQFSAVKAPVLSAVPDQNWDEF